MEGKIKRMERVMEREEREKRKKNLLFKGVQGEGGMMKEEIIKLCGEIGVEVDIEEIRMVKTGKEEKGKMVIVKLRKEDSKRRILENNGKLKGREVWIEEDLTFRERKIK